MAVSRQIRKTVFFVLALLLAHAGAQSSSRANSNVILITIDTLRADHVGCYGAKNVKTPTLDGLARDGVVFERAISQVPLTWPSHAAILTGTYPFQNGVQDFTGQPLAAQFQTVAQAFKRRRYATGAVVSAFVLDRSWGLGRGFDYYDDAFSAETFQKKDIGLVDRRADQSVAHALAWLKKTPKRPFFLWLHLYDPHSPYDAPEPFRSQYKEHPYDGEIAYADHQLASLVKWLKQSKLYDSSLIVLLSDHGESLGEHGEQEHGFFIYNSTVHVPLIVKPPVGRGIQLGRIGDPVETTSVAPTLMSLAGPSTATPDPIEKQFQSPPLFLKSMKTAGSKPDSAYSETFYPFSSFGWNPLHSVQTARYHYIEAPTPELYDLSVDPAETNNIAPEQTATVGVLKDKLQQILKVNPFSNEGSGGSAPAQPKLNADAAEKLRALGYMAYHSPVSAEALASGKLADPKDKLWEFNTILKATDAFQSGDDDQAKSLLSTVREKDTNMYIVPFLMGETALRRKNWDEAANELKRCLALNPSFDQAMAGLARALINDGKSEEARPWLDKALKINPQNYRVWYELGHLESESNAAAAIRAYEKSIEIQPNFAPVRRDLGMLQFRQRNYPQAAEQLGKAANLGINEAPLFNFLGISYSRTDRLQKAVGIYQRALKLDPDYAEAHLNLGFAYQRLARPVQAKEEYDPACRLDPNLCKLVPAKAAN
jgi:arylsulfatase A-like enzyme/Flp pilus assembly protein TadD